jgi:hypothetical protein
MSELKLCKDCRWFIPKTSMDSHVCSAPKNKLRRIPDLVTGDVGEWSAVGAVYCTTHRFMGGSEAHCNNTGDWFQPREATDETEDVGVDGPRTLGDLGSGSGLPVGSDIPELRTKPTEKQLDNLINLIRKR